MVLLLHGDCPKVAPGEAAEIGDKSRSFLPNQRLEGRQVGLLLELPGDCDDHDMAPPLAEAYRSQVVAVKGKEA